jgi:hypothetical protein
MPAIAAQILGSKGRNAGDESRPHDVTAAF